jgi:FkbM family methyltransferase
VVEGLGSGDVFYDIGANVGFFSLLASRVVGPTGTVVALEPHPDVEAAMRANLERNGAVNVRSYQLAAASSTGRLGFAESAHPGGGSLESTGAPLDTVGHLEVDAVRLDDLVARDALPPPTLIKLDIESGELEALRGAAAVVRSARPAILVELDAPTPAELAAKRAPIEDWLRDLGYDVRELAAAYPNRSWQVVHLLATPRPDEP